MTETITPREFPRRWFMLTLFCLYSLTNAYQWIHLNAIANVIHKFYNESLPGDSFQQETAIDWLSMVYMLAYIPLIFPATWIIDRKGLRTSVIIGAFLNAIGAWIKCLAVSQDRFYVLMLAQTICAIAQIFVLGIPAPLAATWFGPSQVSTATSLGVFGNQLGGAVGFVAPPLLVSNSDDLNSIGDDLSKMFYIGAGVTTVLCIVIVIAFQAKPPVPASTAQMLAIQAEETHYLTSLRNLLRNRGFVILTLTYGINTGSFYGISTLLNSIILYYYPSHETDVGTIGLTLIIAGIVGSIIAGIWLDRSKTFKATTLGVYFLSMACMVALTFTIDLNRIWLVFLVAGALGFFMTGYLPVGFEFAAEITYPEPEGTSSGLLNASAQIFGIILTIGMRRLMNQVSVFSATISLSAALALGTLMSGLIPADYRRQRAEKSTIERLDNITIDEGILNADSN